jgi:Rhodopirellula transposase DDE domain
LWYVEWMLTDAEIAARYVKIRRYLDERRRRLWLGVEAQALGSGGVAVIARATGADVKTVRRGTAEIEPGGRVRGPGGGRPGLAELDAGLVPALEALVDPATRGDPMSPLRWTTKPTAHLAGELTRQGHAVTARTVASLLAGAGYSLPGNARTIEGKQHPDRAAQFRYINEAVTAFQDEGSPVISVDAKKKENVGNFENGGAEWAPAGQPERVSVHDFPGRGAGQGHPVRELRPDREHRLGQRRHRPRHRRVRRRLDPVLAERARPGCPPRRPAPADHRRLRRG